MGKSSDQPKKNPSKPKILFSYLFLTFVFALVIISIQFFQWFYCFYTMIAMWTRLSFLIFFMSRKRWKREISIGKEWENEGKRNIMEK